MFADGVCDWQVDFWMLWEGQFHRIWLHWYLQGTYHITQRICNYIEEKWITEHTAKGSIFQGMVSMCLQYAECVLTPDEWQYACWYCQHDNWYSRKKHMIPNCVFQKAVQQYEDVVGQNGWHNMMVNTEQHLQNSDEWCNCYVVCVIKSLAAHTQV